MDENEVDQTITRQETVELFALLDRADRLFALAESQDDLARIARHALREIECRRYARSLELSEEPEPDSADAES